MTTASHEPVLRLAVELPPSVYHSHKNALRRSRRAGRPYTAQVPTGQTLAWRASAFYAARRAIVAARWHPITEGKVVVELTYFWPDRRRRDTHNRIKELMDALQAAGAFAKDEPEWQPSGCGRWFPAARGDNLGGDGIIRTALPETRAHITLSLIHI